MSTQSTSVSHREIANNELMHRRGCPMRPERIEITTSRAPVTRTKITIARCTDCGNQVVLGEDGETFDRENSADEELGNGKAHKANARRRVPEARPFAEG